MKANLKAERVLWLKCVGVSLKSKMRNRCRLFITSGRVGSSLGGDKNGFRRQSQKPKQLSIFTENAFP